MLNLQKIDAYVYMGVLYTFDELHNYLSHYTSVTHNTQ